MILGSCETRTPMHSERTSIHLYHHWPRIALVKLRIDLRNSSEAIPAFVWGQIGQKRPARRIHMNTVMRKLAAWDARSVWTKISKGKEDHGESTRMIGSMVRSALISFWFANHANATKPMASAINAHSTSECIEPADSVELTR